MTSPREQGAASRVARKLLDGVVLPPDPEGMNDDRAEWADDVLRRFASITDMHFLKDQPELVSDLIADIHHWCDRNGVDFDQSVANAAGHYIAETSPDIPF
jgi:hypothetical protein